jgi:hypothetical protein
MKTKTAALLLSVVVFAVVVTASGPVWAASEVPPGGTFLTVDPQARGTKLAGTLTVYYKSVGNTFLRAEGEGCILPEFEANMFFFMRLKKAGGEFQGFAGRENTSQAAILCLDDFVRQQQIVESFVRAKVVPFLFPATPDAPFALKAFSNVVQDEQFNFPGMLFFGVIDVEFRVRERAGSN